MLLFTSLADSIKDVTVSTPKQLGARRRGTSYPFKVTAMGDATNNTNHGPQEFDVGQTSSQPVITGALGNPQFNYRMPEEQTPNSNVPFNLAQLSQFTP